MLALCQLRFKHMPFLQREYAQNPPALDLETKKKKKARKNELIVIVLRGKRNMCQEAWQ